jgi:hypothetical protein
VTPVKGVRPVAREIIAAITHRADSVRRWVRRRAA